MTFQQSIVKIEHSVYNYLTVFDTIETDTESNIGYDLDRVNHRQWSPNTEGLIKETS